MDTSYLYGGEVELAFDARRHKYKVLKPSEKAGYKVSVTGALIIDKSGPLMGWQGNLSEEYLIANLKPGQALNEVEILTLAAAQKRYWRSMQSKAANIGTIVHQFAEGWGRCSLDQGPMPEYPIEASAKNGCNAFTDWTTQHKVVFGYVERRIYSREHDYAGTVDFIGEVDGKLTVADYKTSAPSSSEPTGIYPEYAAQLAAYRLAIDEEGFLGRPIEQAMVLRFDKETGEFEAHTLQDYEADRGAFLSCLALKRWLDHRRAA